MLVNANALTIGEKLVAGTSGQSALHSLGIVALPAITRIGVEYPEGTVMASGRSIAGLGSCDAGSAVTKTLTIRNSGLVPLTIASVTIDGTDAADFVISSPPAASVDAGTSTMVAVTFTAAGSGFNRNAALHIATNDPYTPTFHLNLAATITGTLTATYHDGTEVPLTAAAFTATGSSVNFALNYPPATGSALTVVANTGQGFINGAFGNLAQGQMVTLSYGGTDYIFVANYFGGNGNDLVLQWAANRPFAWGANSNGQLGDGGTENNVVPIPVNNVGVLSGKTIIAVATGNYHSLALCSDGTLASWGGNSMGQLGNGSVTNSNVPVAVIRTGILSGRTVVAVSVGDSHSLALCSDGVLAAWGANSYGQLGDGGTTNSTVPAAVNAIGVLAGKSVVTIAAGANQNLALCADGTVAAWGANSSGQLGNGYTTQSNVPVAVNTTGVLAGKTIVAVAASGKHSLALCSDGALAAWGYNYNGQLGNGSTTSSNVPVVVNMTGMLAGKTVVAVAAGGGQSLVLCADGTPGAWGYNSFGQLGNGGTTDSNVPVQVNTTGALAGKSVVAVSGGVTHNLARCTDGTVVAWGANSNGQLGIGNTTQSNVPVMVNTSRLAVDERFTVVTSGQSAAHSLGIVAGPSGSRIVVEQAGGMRMTSGRNTVDFGSGGVGSGITRMFTVKNTGILPLAIGSVTVDGANAADFFIATPPSASVAAGSSTTLGVTFTAAAGGFNRNAVLHIASNDPNPGTFDIGLVATVTGTLTAAFGGGSEIPLSATALTATGCVVNLSLNYAPPTGTTLVVVKNTGPGFINGTFVNLAQGQQVTLNYGGVDYKFVANYYGGSGNDLVLQWAATRPFSWGSNSAGQLGNGSAADSGYPAPVSTAGALAGKTVIDLAAGSFHSLALCSDGTLAAWGYNASGELGNGTTTSSTVPVAVSMTGALAGKKVIAVSVGSDHSLALCSDGSLAAWGNGNSGKLGNGSNSSSSVPVAVNLAGVLSGKAITAIATGDSHSLALCSDGTLAAWGDNLFSELGNAVTTTSSTIPVTVTPGVLAGKTVMGIAASGHHSQALCSDGTLAAWGTNNYGQLGDGSTTNRNAPVMVNMTGALAGKSVVATAAGASHALALCSDGTLAAWGNNMDGCLGNGTTNSGNPPVAVTTTGALAGKTLVAVAAGDSNSMTLCADGTLAAWGNNYYGQLGNISSGPSYVPVAVSMETLAAGERFLAGRCSPNGRHALGLVAMPFIPRLMVEQPSGKGLNTARSTVDFGSCAPGNAVSKTFTIRNNGIVPITITAVTIDGSNAADFVVTAPPAASVAAGSSTTFAVTFTAQTGFSRNAALHLASNDPYVSDFNFNLTATSSGTLTAAYNNGSEIPVSAASFTATGSNVNFSLNYAPATGTTLTVVRNTGPGFINGTFGNLAQGQIVTLNYGGVDYRFMANYYGGSSNDLVLQWAATRPLAWGDNFAGQLGDGSTTTRYAPVAVATTGALAGKTILATATGYGFSMAVCSDGTVAAWGRNTVGQLGNGTTTASNVPVAVSTTGALAGKKVIAVSAGYDHTLALCADGTLAAWGNNSAGKLGNSSYTSSNVPVAVTMTGALVGKKVVAISAGYDHSIALCDDGNVASWGSLLGNASSASSNNPVAAYDSGALAGKTVTAVAAGSGLSLVLCSDGTPLAWGSDIWGQLGNGSASSSTVPAGVDTTGALSGKTVVAIAAGNHHGLSLCSDGRLATWGFNTYGQLGNGSTSDSYAPVAVNQTGVLAGKSVVAVATGYQHSLARCSDGTLAAWGGDSALGNGSGSSSSVPVVVSTGTLAVGECFMAATSAQYATHNLALAAMPFISRIVVEQPGGTGLANGFSTVDFGSMAAGAALSKTFTIRNNGIVPLVINSVSIDGSNSTDFALTTPPAASVAAGSSTAFTVTFTAGAGFNRSAVLHIASNDPYTPAFQLNLGATIAGILTATYHDGTEVPLTAAAFTATGSSVNFALNYPPATGTSLTVVGNTGPGFINGTFDNLAQGQLVTLSYGGVDYKFVANYYGGSGNDLVLQWAATRPVACGLNSSGQLGNGNTTNSNVPVAVSTTGALVGKTLIATVCGLDFSLALCSDNTLAAWGNNSSGQLGNGGTTTSNVPVAVTMTGALSGKRVINVTAGYSHSLALCSDGTLAAWGNNTSGQLGNGGTTTSNVPVAVTMTGALAGKTVVAVAAGNYHSLALCSDGTLAAWGSNSYGQFGNGSTTSSNVPVAVNTSGVLAGRLVISISAGSSFSLAVCSDGTVAAWGSNSVGQLGNGTTTSGNVPGMVSAAGVLSGKTVVAATAGDSFSLALCADGTLAAWGYNSSGQLGNGSTSGSNLPVAVNAAGTLAGKTVVAIAAGSSHSLAMCADGTLTAWGYNYYGQLGSGGISSSNVPVAVSAANLVAGEKFIAVGSGQSASHNMGIVAMPFIPRIAVEQPAGTAITSGASTVDFESNGAGTGTSKTFTIRNNGIVPLMIGSVVIDGSNASEFAITASPDATVAAGSSTTLAVTFTAGAGFNRSATLRVVSNDPYTGDFHFPLTSVGSGVLNAVYNSGADVPLSVSHFSATGSSLNFTLNFAPPPGTIFTVVQNTGRGFIQGNFSNLSQGQVVALGYGDMTYRFVANYYGGSGNDLVLQWAATRPFAWGSNSYGQLGDGGTAASNLPVEVNTGDVLAGKTLAMVAGSYHSLALCSDGTLAAWGNNSFGELGNGNATNSNVPVAVNVTGVLFGKTVIAADAGAYHNLAFCSDGTLAAWGSNGNGQLGDGTTTSRNVPVTILTTGVLSAKTVIAVSAGGYHSLALCSDGTLASWGYNNYGQLGNGSTTSSPVPVAVNVSGALAGKTVIAITSGNYHSLALCSDGTMAAWGYNTYGQLGNNNITGYYSDVPVTVSSAGMLSGKTAVAIAVGNYHSLALCSDGTLAAWGYNGYGQLGDNTATTTTVPVAVDTVAGVSALFGKTVVGISAGTNHSMALCSDGTLAAWGSNGNGQLGDGTTTQHNVPTAVSTAGLPDGAVFVAGVGGAGASHSLGIVADPLVPRIAVECPAGDGLIDGVSMVDFGQVSNGGNAQRTITLRNTGNTELKNLFVNLDGPNADDFTVGSPDATTLAPGAATTFAVDFSPTGFAIRSAAIHIVSNVAGTTNPFDIQLAGTGLTNLETWRLTNFQTADDCGPAADMATPCNDGIVNLLKFATGMDPTRPGVMPGTCTPVGALLVFTYTRSKVAVSDGITFTVEWSDTLTAGSWSHSGVTETASDQGDTNLVTATLPAGPGSGRFARLRVGRP